MKKGLAFLLVFAFLISLCACAKVEPAPSNPEPAATEEPAVPTEEPEPINGPDYEFTMENFPVMDGSTSVVPLAKALAQKLLNISAEEADTLIEFHRTTTSYKNLMDGACDIVIAGEPAMEVFAEKSSRGFEWEKSQIGSDALVFVVNANNPVSNLTTEQIVGIYTGKIKNWKELGGDDNEIIPFIRNSTAGSQALMEKSVMRGAEFGETPKNYTIESMAGLMEGVKSYDNSAGAIGYSVYYYANDMRMAEGLKLLSVDGVAPSDKTIASGEYPHLTSYSATIAASTPQDAPARILYDWLLSEDGQRFIASHGYVSSAGEFVPAKQESLFTRLRDEQIDDLVPSADYGPISPFAGEKFEVEGDYYECLYGLCTAKGEIIVDPVFSDVYLFTNAERDMGAIAETIETYPAICLERTTNELDEYDWPKVLYGAAALDGAWYTGCIYDTIVASPKYLCCRAGVKITVLDYSGKKISEFDIPRESYVSRFDDHDMALFQRWDGGQSTSYFINIYGDKISPEHNNYNDFSCDRAVFFADNGDVGVVDRSFNVVVEPGNYAYISSFLNGSAVANINNGSEYSYYIIDTNGKVMFYSDKWLSYSGGDFYEYYSYDDTSGSSKSYYIKNDGSKIISDENTHYFNGLFWKNDGTLSISIDNGETFVDTGLDVGDSWAQVELLKDDDYLISAGSAAYIWNAKTGKLLFITGCDFAYSLGEYIMAGDYDDSSANSVYDRTGKRLASGYAMGGMEFTPDFTVLSSLSDSYVIYKDKIILHIDNSENAPE